MVNVEFSAKAKFDQDSAQVIEQNCSWDREANFLYFLLKLYVLH